MSKITNIQLVVIDPQNDFCDPKGTLFVPGADQDMKVRLPKMVKRLLGKIDEIHVTLDSHHKFDIAHPMYWKDSAGKHPGPFTCISAQDVEQGKWTTSVPSLYKRSLEYVRTLAKNARYPLVIWPEHCLIGSWGAGVVPELFEQLKAWEDQVAMVNYITKGSNPYTEHYSGVCADVPDPKDPTTHINKDWIDILQNADIIAIAGEASSHCIANTVRDICTNFTDPKYAQKMVILEDAMSAVPSFEKLADDFFNDMKAKGVQFAKTTDFLI